MKPEESASIKKIALLMTETDVDIKYDIEHSDPKALWIQAFWEGANFVTDVLNKAICKAITGIEEKVK